MTEVTCAGDTHHAAAFRAPRTQQKVRTFWL